MCRRFILCISLFGVQVVAGHAQPSPPHAHEVFVTGSYGSYAGVPRTADRRVNAEYYYAAGADTKLFLALALQRRYDLMDQSVGGGFYHSVHREHNFYGAIFAGINPEISPRVDGTLEYSTVLMPTVIGGVGYRAMVFRDETVHSLSPSTEIYLFPRWILWGRVTLARLQSDANLRVTFLVRARHDMSDNFVPLIWYFVGSEAARAASVEDVRSMHSWGVGTGTDVRLSGPLSVRCAYEYMRRTGFHSLHTVTLTLSTTW